MPRLTKTKPAPKLCGKPAEWEILGTRICLCVTHVERFSWAKPHLRHDAGMDRTCTWEVK